MALQQASSSVVVTDLRSATDGLGAPSTGQESWPKRGPKDVPVTVEISKEEAAAIRRCLEKAAQ